MFSYHDVHVMLLVASVDVNSPRINDQILEQQQKMDKENEHNIKMFDAFMIFDRCEAYASYVDDIEHESHT